MVKPRSLVILSWLLAIGMVCEGIWQGSVAGFLAPSGLMVANILALWSRKEAQPVRTKQWWALLFVSNFWGIEAAFWIKLHGKGATPDSVVITCLAVLCLHIVLSLLVWRDKLKY